MQPHSLLLNDGKTIRFVDLPDDMRVLIKDYCLENRIPDNLPLVELELSSIPKVPLDQFDRGTWHARNMRFGNVPPLIIANGYFMDGKHRRFAFEEQGVQSVIAIDLSGLADPDMVAGNEMGKLGEPGQGYGTRHDQNEYESFKVWCFKRQSFASKKGRHTHNIMEAESFSMRDIAGQFASLHEYECFRTDDLAAFRLKLVIGREEGGAWYWRYRSGQSANGSTGLPTRKACLEAARLDAEARLLNVKDVDPFPMGAYLEIERKCEARSEAGLSHQSYPEP